MKLMMAMIMVLGVSGCSKEQPRDPVLKAMLKRTDVVLIKNFYRSTSVGIPVSGSPGPEETWMAGGITMDPVIVFEPPRESRKIKGLVVTVDEPGVFGEGGAHPGRSHESVLDEKEARDLEAALSYQADTASRWLKNNPGYHTEVMFQSRDDFRITLIQFNQETALVATSGAVQSASETIPMALLPELQSKLRDAIATLDKN